jgi:hypothetical protein
LHGAQRIEADDPERRFAAGNGDVGFHRRVGSLDLGQARDARVESLVEAAARATDYEIGLSSKVMGRQTHFVEGAGIDEMNRNADGNAEGDGNDCERGAAGILA